MANFLNLRCPGCGETDKIEVLVRVWMRPGANGAWTIRPNAIVDQIDAYDSVTCFACRAVLPVSSFLAPAPVAQPEKAEA